MSTPIAPECLAAAKAIDNKLWPVCGEDAAHIPMIAQIIQDHLSMVLIESRTCRQICEEVAWTEEPPVRHPGAGAGNVERGASGGSVKLAFHRIPIYDLRFWVCTGSSDEVWKQRVKMKWAFGVPSGDCHGCPGLCAFEAGRVGLFLQADRLCHELIAHEVFHATHRMMEYCDSRFFPEAQEPFAYLHGHLTHLVYADLKKWRVPVAAVWPAAPTRSR